MEDKIKADIVFYLHVIVLLFGIVAPPILPKKYIKYVLFYVILIIIHWKVFNGCILTILEKKYLHKPHINTYVGGFLDSVFIRFFNLHLSENALKIISTAILLWQTIIYIYRFTHNLLLTFVINLIYAMLLIKYLM